VGKKSESKEVVEWVQSKEDVVSIESLERVNTSYLDEKKLGVDLLHS
jgi:hypothetical protein